VRRILLFLVLLALALPALLVLATNVVLKKPQFVRGWVSENPESTLLAYDDAGSDFPGRVWVKGFLLRSRDENTEWIARIDDARLTVSLFELVKKRFHAEHVRGGGLSFRLRRRLPPKEISPAVVQRQPPIEGFPSPPRAESPEATRPEDPTTWRVAIDDLAVDGLRELWIEGFRFEGQGRVSGAFALHPTIDAQVGPSKLELASGELRFGRDPIASPIEGTIECAIPAFRTHEYPGNEIFKIVDGRAKVTGAVASLEFLNAILSEPKRPRFGAGKGRLDFDAALGRGTGTGTMRVETAGTVVRFGEETIRSTSVLELRAKRVDFARHAGDFSGSSLAIRDATLSGKEPESGWWGRFTFAPSRLDMKSGVWTTRVDARAKSPRPILTMLDVEVPNLGTKLVKLEDLHASADIRLGGGRVEVHDLTAKGGDALVEGEYAKKAARAKGAFLVSKGILHVGVGVENGQKAKLRVLKSRGWFKEAAGRPSLTDGQPGD
jgi:hypothetical protein